VEAGAASAVVAISKEAGIPLAPSQADLTPFQRMVLIKELERQHEEAQDNGAGAGSSPSPVNQMRSPGGGGNGETTVYTNDGGAEE